MKPLPDLAGRITLRPVEAARAVGVSLDTLLSWRDGGLPHVIRGRSILIPVDALRAWLARQIVPVGHEHKADFPGNNGGAVRGAAEFGAGGPAK
jgi:excisionase family DNA binding protein